VPERPAGGLRAGSFPKERACRRPQKAFPGLRRSGSVLCEYSADSLPMAAPAWRVTGETGGAAKRRRFYGYN
jgi:hypothetical protein